MVNVELRPHGIAPMNATSLFMVFWSSMLFPDSGGDAPVPSSMLFPDSGFEIAEEPLGRNPAWAQFQWNHPETIPDYKNENQKAFLPTAEDVHI